jgi:hypothetical protein
MNRNVLLLFILCVGPASAQTKYDWYTEGSNNKPTRRISFSVSNPLDIPLKKEGVVVPWQGITMLIKDKYHPKYFNITSNGGNHVFEVPITNDLSYQYMVFAGWSMGEVRNNEEEFVKYVELNN